MSFWTKILGAIVLTADSRSFQTTIDALLVGVSLAVAAVPEGLPAIMSAATLRPYIQLVQPAMTSNAGMPRTWSFSWTQHAVDGKIVSCEQVPTMIASSASGAMPASTQARRSASEFQAAGRRSPFR